MRTGLYSSMRRGPILAMLACSCVMPLKGEHICAEAFQAVALRTLECTGDVELANDRYEQFQQNIEYITSVDNNDGDVARQMECPSELARLPCDEVVEKGDRLDWWQAQSPSCVEVFAIRTQTPPSETGGTGTTPTSTVPIGGTCVEPYVLDLRGVPIGGDARPALCHQAPGRGLSRHAMTRKRAAITSPEWVTKNAK